MAKIASLILILALASTSFADFFAPLKKGQDVSVKEVTAGYKITVFDGAGTHKIVAVEPDCVTLIDLTGTTTIRINKNAVLSITEIKLATK